MASAAAVDSDVGRAHAVLAFIHRMRREHAESEREIHAATAHWERVGHYSLMADGYVSIGEAHRASGRLDSALSWFSRAEDLWRRVGNGHELMATLCVGGVLIELERYEDCLLYTSPSPRDATLSRMPSSA